MPIYLRGFYFQELLKLKKIEKEEIDKVTKKSSQPKFQTKFNR
jgi:hypothetical protein